MQRAPAAELEDFVIPRFFRYAHLITPSMNFNFSDCICTVGKPCYGVFLKITIFWLISPFRFSLLLSLPLIQQFDNQILNLLRRVAGWKYFCRRSFFRVTFLVTGLSSRRITSIAPESSLPSSLSSLSLLACPKLGAISSRSMMTSSAACSFSLKWRYNPLLV